MKRLIALTGIIVIICLLISASAGTAPIKADATEKAPVPPSASEPETQSTPEEPPVSYVLKAFNKRVAVFENDSSTPIYISPTRISDLPEEDRRLLQAGIAVPDRKALKRLLEDYCS